jgi:serine/threonine-protein phosphatase with EF-hand domain
MQLATTATATRYTEENRINSREGIMAAVNKTLGSFIGQVGRTLSGGSDNSSSPKTADPRSSPGGGKSALPSLTTGSINNLLSGLGKNERVAMVDAIAILKAAAVLFMEGDSVCDIEVPVGGKCVVVGDLHGQLVGRGEGGKNTRCMCKESILPENWPQEI